MPSTHLLTRVGTHLFDRLGDWNPQLLRELKGRLKWFPVLAAIGLSLLVQGVMWIVFALALPGPVVTDDLYLSTYPEIGWDRYTQLQFAIQEKVLPAATPDRETIANTSAFITWVNPREPIQGSKAMGLEALDQIQVGDRLVAVNGIAAADLYPTSDFPDSDFWTFVDNLNASLKGTDRTYSIDPETQKLIDTQATLTLYRPDQGEFTVQLPRIAIVEKNNRYCLDSFKPDSVKPYDPPCEVTADKAAYRIDWPHWYRDLFTTLTIAIVFPLMAGGVFFLANNLAEEKRRGTLNFLRLSPRSSFTLLSGKILGVPICLYLAIALALPLHGLTGWLAGYNAGYLLGFDLTLIAQTLLFYLLAVLFSISTANTMLLTLQPWLLASGAIVFNWIMVAIALTSHFPESTDTNPLMWSVLFSPFISLSYFGDRAAASLTPNSVNLMLGIFRVNFTEYTAIAVVHAIGWYTVLGHAIQRRFTHPHLTLLQRRYSYPLTALVFAILLGLTGHNNQDYEVFPYLMLIGILSVFYFMTLAIALTSDRQTLQDWARYRHAQAARSQRLGLWQDLLIGDTSSPIISFGLNLALGTALFSGWFLLNYGDHLENLTDQLILGCSLLLFVGSLLFSVLVNQILLLTRRQKNWFWFTALGSISSIAFPALTLLSGLLILGPYPQPSFIIGLPAELAVFTLPLSLLGTVTAILSFVHIRQIRLVGRSETQALLQSSAS